MYGGSSGAARTTPYAGMEIGGQHVFDSGVTLGGGGGLIFVGEKKTRIGPLLDPVSGVVPRLLFTVGYSF